MGVEEDIANQVKRFLSGTYTTRVFYRIPTLAHVPIGDTGLFIDGTVLCAHMKKRMSFDQEGYGQIYAKVFKAFLWAVARIVRHNHGEVRNFKSNTVLAIFVSPAQVTNAVTAAYEATHIIRNILQPQIKKYCKVGEDKDIFPFDYGLGLHKGRILVVKAGIQSTADHDLLWIGDAVDFATKLAWQAATPHNIYVSSEVFEGIAEDLKAGGEDPWQNATVTYAGSDEEVFRTRQHRGVTELITRRAVEEAVEVVEEAASEVAPLIEALKDNNEGVKWVAASALGEMGDEEAVAPLIEALTDNSEAVRRAAATSLGKLGSEKSAEPLMKSLKDKTEGIRCAAAIALGILGKKSAIEPIKELLSEESLLIRVVAAGALKRLGDDSASAVIDEVKSEPSASVRKELYLSLAYLSDFSIVPDLLQSLEADSPIAGKLAQSLLREISKEDYGEDVENWREWWRNHPTNPATGEKRIS